MNNRFRTVVFRTVVFRTVVFRTFVFRTVVFRTVVFRTVVFRTVVTITEEGEYLSAHKLTLVVETGRHAKKQNFKKNIFLF